MADATNNHDSEIWEDIVDWPDYQVSNMGRVRSLDRIRHQKQRGTLAAVLYKGSIRRQSVCKRTGYRKVGLSRPGKRQTVAVHVLVCEAFHGPKPHKYDAAHWNGIKQDNRAENLRWTTRKDNLSDRERHGTVNRGERNGMSKFTDEQCLELMQRRAAGAQLKDLAEEYGMSEGHAWDIVRGRRRGNMHYGWRQ
jgi:hypothetical protein